MFGETPARPSPPASRRSAASRAPAPPSPRGWPAGGAGEGRGDPPAEGRRRPDLAHDLGRHALGDLRQAAAVGHQRDDRVALDVDEAGAGDQPRRLDDLARPLGRQPPGRRDRDHPIPGERDIAPEPGVAGAVDHPRPADQHLDPRHPLLPCRAPYGGAPRKTTDRPRRSRRPPSFSFSVISVISVVKTLRRDGLALSSQLRASSGLTRRWPRGSVGGAGAIVGAASPAATIRPISRSRRTAATSRCDGRPIRLVSSSGSASRS